MALLAAGAAFIDRSGAVLAADQGFLTRLGVPVNDGGAALQARARSSPELHALLAGDGPAVASIPGADGPVEVERVPAADGALLVVRDPRVEDRVEHALRSQVFGRVIAGVAHDIKNPLNAMSLQLALLGDKLEGEGEASLAADAHLGALREQIARVNEVLRRLVDVTDPPAPLGYTDVGVLLADVAGLFGYEARRRRIETAPIELRPGAVRTRCDPCRVGKLVLGLYGRALSSTPDGGRFAARAEARSGEAVVAVEHAAGDSDAEVRYDTDVLTAGAESVGGRLESTRGDRSERLVLVMPGNK